MFNKIAASTLALAAAASLAAAESHTVSFINSCNFEVQPAVCSNDIDGYCWFGPTLAPNGDQTSFTQNGPLISFISYGSGNGVGCLENGENCLITEGTLQDIDDCEGCNSVDLSLIPPHGFNFGNSFGFSDGSGSHGCESANCWSAFHQDGNDGVYQIQSNGQGVGIGIEYCNGGGDF